jgi:hypothetical protein
LFKQGGIYRAVISAVERYNYVGEKPSANPVADEVPALDGNITVSNGLSSRDDNTKTARYLKSDNTWAELDGTTHTFNLQNNGTVIYEFSIGNPDFLVQTDPEDTYAKSMGITIVTGGNTIYWPNTTDAGIQYKAYVLGGKKLPGTDFVTQAPADIESILRVPPGSASSISITEDSVFSNETTQVNRSRGDWDLGAGVKVEVDISAPIIGLGLAGGESTNIVNTYGESTNSNERTTTSSTTLSTSLSVSASDAVGQGDYFVSTSRNLEIGRSTNVRLFSVCQMCIIKMTREQLTSCILKII